MFVTTPPGLVYTMGRCIFVIFGRLAGIMMGFHYDGIPTDLNYQNTRLGFTDTVANTSSSQSHSFTFDVPFNATLLEDVNVWMGWTSVGPPDHPPAHFYQAEIDSIVVNS